jgi:hypothetical protein
MWLGHGFPSPNDSNYAYPDGVISPPFLTYNQLLSCILLLLFACLKCNCGRGMWIEDAV